MVGPVNITGHKPMKDDLWKYKICFPEATIRTMSINKRLLSEGITFEIINIMGGTQNVRKYSINCLTGSPPIPTQLQPHLSLSLCIKTLILLYLHYFSSFFTFYQKVSFIILFLSLNGHKSDQSGYHIDTFF